MPKTLGLATALSALAAASAALFLSGCAVRPEAIIDAVGKLLATLDQKEAKGK